MIVSNRNYPFGTRIATIASAMFNCRVSTAKEGFFKKQSTMILECSDPHCCDRGRPVGKIIYSPSLRSFDRLQMHELICVHLNVAGETQPLAIAINLLGEMLRARGIATEVINIA